MFAFVLWKVLIGVAAILLLFSLFAWLLARSKRTHCRRFGGISYWEVVYGRFPRFRRRKP